MVTVLQWKPPEEALHLKDIVLILFGLYKCKYKTVIKWIVGAVTKATAF